MLNLNFSVMRKNTSGLPSCSLPFIILFFSMLGLLTASAQNCTDIDKPRYPIIINGVETSPGVYQNTSFSWNNTWNFSSLKQTRVTGLDIGGTDLFHGLFQYLPPSYSLSQNSTKEYPVIIYFHGGGSVGNGSADQLCRLFKDLGTDLNTHLSIPGKVERNTSLFTQTISGETLEYIVISPQFSEYKRLVANEHFPTANEVEDVIDYVESHYRIDPRRIYLTGFSNGANMITEYAASSLARAKRVAAIMPVALCSQRLHADNTSRGYSATYIGQAKLKTWFVYCESDNCGGAGDFDVPVDWTNAIKAISGHSPPRITVLKNQNPASLYNCSDTLLHDAWSRAYDPNFRASFDLNTGLNDGVNLNMYEWFSNQVNTLLPVKLKSFTAKLENDNGVLNWVTTDERDNASFTIERAGADQQFTAIGSVPGAVNNKGEKSYSFTDTDPLEGIGFYRLVQIDVDGGKNYFEIKKILNRKDAGTAVIAAPNPFTGSVSAFVSLERAQKVSITVSDMNGKIIQTSSGNYAKGNSEIKLRSEELPKGVYLLKVSGIDFSSTLKILKK